MTLPLEVNFWNMAPQPSLEAAAQEEVRSLEPDATLTSCRVRIARLKAESAHPCYDIRVVALAGAQMLSAESQPSWSLYGRHDTAETALHRAFAKIHAQLRVIPN